MISSFQIIIIQIKIIIIIQIIIWKLEIIKK